MAEYAFIPKTPLGTELSDDKKALLFFCSQLLSEHKPETSLKEKYKSITQRALHIPCFVLDRSQSFDHNASHSGEKCYSFQDQFMINEVKLFLPSSLKQVDFLERDVQIALKQELSPVLAVASDEQCHTGPVADSANAEKQTCAEENRACTVGDDCCPAYLKCSTIPTSLGSDGKCLEICFIYLPSWDELSLEVHYMNVKVNPVQPQSNFLSRMIHKGHEKIDLVGTRSIMKFSMITPTAIETVNILESKGKHVSEEATKFITEASVFTILSTNAMALNDDQMSTPDSDEPLDQESSTDKPREEDESMPIN